MRIGDRSRRVRLSVEVDPELHRRVKIAATERDMTIKEYVIGILEGVAEEEEARRKRGDARSTEDLARLSAAAFARDWESEEDSVYDELS